ncbi:hypothetical protein E3G52_000382 [Mycobacteroides abscessus]|nr:hypothetical protein [Mycobacteroides abscessus]MBE5453518.1 hypothetical protein [Mycobacteroides abscessus]
MFQSTTATVLAGATAGALLGIALGVALFMYQVKHDMEASY